MNPIKPVLYILLFLAALVAVLFLPRSCREADLPEAPTPAEQKLQRVVAADTTERAMYRKQAQYWQMRFKADSARLAVALQKDKLQTEKTQHSAKEYEKTPTLPNCDKALKDCQEENETKRFALAVQERMLNAADSSRRVYLAEIDRRGAVIDTLAAGWQEANTALRTAAKRKPWAVVVVGGSIITQDKITPFVGAGISYTLIRW